MKARFRASLRRSFQFAAGVLPAATVFAQVASSNQSAQKLDDVVVTATRTPIAITTAGSAIDAIGSDELSRMQLPLVRNTLSLIPGAPAAASGAPGGVTSLFLRGTNSNQTLFLVDGVRFNDPNTDYAVALGGACIGACDSLEVAHGPQSTLYGGEAVGGVVAIRGERGRGPGSGSIAVEAGSFGTVQGALSAQGGSDASAYTFSAAGGHTDNERVHNAFDSASYNLRLDRKVSDAISVGATWRGFLATYEDPGDRYTNDPDNEDRESNQLATIFADFTHSPELKSHAILGGQFRRFVAENPGPFGTSITTVKNKRALLDWQTTWQAATNNRLTGGFTAEANHTRNTGFGDIDESQQLLALFVQDEFSPVENVYLTAGLRHDDFDTFGNATTGRATAAWLAVPDRVKLRGSYGTAFRAPGFLDLYGQSAFYVGNPNLKPEKARGWDAGVDYYLAQNRGTVSATWFDTRLRDLIVFDFGVFPGTTANVEKARTRGVELSAKFDLPNRFKARFAYTYLEADNLSENTRLLRRPRQSGAVDVWHEFSGGFSAGVGGVWVAQREDVDAATFATIEGEDFTTVRIYCAWQVTRALALKVRLENVLNEKYEEVNGYPALGFGAFGGMEWKF